MPNLTHNRVTLKNTSFTFVNYELRKISSDKVTPKWLIINAFWCHLSLVTFAFTTVFGQNAFIKES